MYKMHEAIKAITDQTIKSFFVGNHLRIRVSIVALFVYLFVTHPDLDSQYSTYGMLRKEKTAGDTNIYLC